MPAVGALLRDYSMLRLLAGAALAALVAFAPLAVSAQSREFLGFGRLITNDFLGDGRDRGQTGSIASSHVWGRSAWQDRLPDQIGDLLELRLGMQVMAPADLRTPASDDRPYAGALSIGLHSHFDYHGFDMSLGGDLVATGPDTGLGSLHREFHDLIGERPPSRRTLDGQLGNGLHPTLVAETGRRLALSDQVRIRPFIEGRAGAESLLRAGFDVEIGRIGQQDLQVRAISTGQRYRAIQSGDATGFSFVLGADTAHVADSIYLPEERGLVLTDSRDRLRAGVHWQGEGASAFYGLTWLGREFESQPDDQVIGSLRVNLQF
jgi:hypothetical protein